MLVEKLSRGKRHEAISQPRKRACLPDSQCAGALSLLLGSTLVFSTGLILLIALARAPYRAHVNSALILCTKHGLKGMTGAVGSGVQHRAVNHTTPHWTTWGFGHRAEVLPSLLRLFSNYALCALLDALG